MKIAKGIRDAYHRSSDNYRRLSEEVCTNLRHRVEENKWFFSYRLKEMESFSLKVETGRVADPARMEDFFACTIVVPTVSQIADAEALLKETYEVNERRPPCDDITRKRASDFVFDDLRLYLKRGPSDTGKNEDLVGMVFEVQVKTILQYAWGIASHDLIYKTDNVSWPKERIAFQVKAMLEHAEISIAEAQGLAESLAISKSDRDTASTLQIIEVLRDFWPADQLPQDIKRLAESIRGVLKACNVQPDGLKALLESEKARSRILPTNLSPYAFLVQAFAHNPQVGLKAKILNGKYKGIKIIVHDDTDLPEWMSRPNANIIRV